MGTLPATILDDSWIARSLPFDGCVVPCAVMKTRITAALSLAGVLVAGSAAALVNTQVLSNSSPAGDGGGQVVTTTQAPLGSTTLPVVTTVPAATVPVAPSAVATQAAYQIGTAGVVTLDTAGQVLTIVGVSPAAGWTVVKSEQGDAFHVEVAFQQGNLLVEFHANYLFGVVGTAVESKDLAAPASTTPSAGSTHDDDDDHGDDHDDDDDHQGDDHGDDDD